ncbi:MAG: cell division protein FtsW [Flavobacterium sp. BFFFF2]|nr:MAG: cell division protein FtsW [Flavobacterium sp. BFFFF2]
MKELIHRLKGDKGIWGIVALMALISFLPVFSASSNLAYTRHGSGNTLTYLIKHGVQMSIGLYIMYRIHKIPYSYFRGLSKILLPLVYVLLVYTLLRGTKIDGANASRWIQIPFVGITFQTSALAAIVLYIYVAHYLSKKREAVITFKESFIYMWLPVFGVLALILPANFSTTALIFFMVCMLVYVGKYPLKYIAAILGSGFIALVFFILVAKAFPTLFPNRVDTWISRIENFTGKKGEFKDDYQIEKAKIAIACGGMNGVGPGKSVQKNFLPQSSSDFIFAIIVEEWGLIGALGIMLLYFVLLARFVIQSQKTQNLFGRLLIIGLGFPIIFQALINMSVAVELMPVTGQTLPLISSGGSSIWMTCISLGIIISVTKKEEEFAEEQAEKRERDEVIERLIDKHLQEEEEARLAAELEANNPLEPILNSPDHAK